LRKRIARSIQDDGTREIRALHRSRPPACQRIEYEIEIGAAGLQLQVIPLPVKIAGQRRIPHCAVRVSLDPQIRDDPDEPDLLFRTFERGRCAVDGRVQLEREPEDLAGGKPHLPRSGYPFRTRNRRADADVSIIALRQTAGNGCDTERESERKRRHEHEAAYHLASTSRTPSIVPRRRTVAAF
jgi:hypothetical protein